MLAFAAVILFLIAAAAGLAALAGFAWGILEWIYEAWFKKEPEPNGWCPRLAEETKPHH
ncbi:MULTISPECIES: hypothetical protein [Neisseria]|uniref:hypothetical protein n=1 Tax=Neisseria TaxID=482 RepID=UPI0007C99C9C|nr:hypothetical protein [Neisseria weaveri]SAY50937.1 Uncharacterised protein [Neisseria weaveri]